MFILEIREFMNKSINVLMNVTAIIVSFVAPYTPYIVPTVDVVNLSEILQANVLEVHFRLDSCEISNFFENTAFCFYLSGKNRKFNPQRLAQSLEKNSNEKITEAR